MTNTQLTILLQHHINAQDMENIFNGYKNIINHPLMFMFGFDMTTFIDDFTDIDTLERDMTDGDDEYAYYLDFDPMLIAKMMSKGLFPMAMEFFGYYLPIMRHHTYKVAIPLNPDNKFSYHKSILRYARRMPHLTLQFDRDFIGTVNDINDAYKSEGTWLAPQLTAAYKTILDANDTDTYPAKVHSVELYDGDKRIAGEIGFISGDVYTSLSGYHSISGSGGIQMAALGTYMLRNGFTYWDLGMQIPYKYDYGGLDFDRAAQRQMHGDCPKECRTLTSDVISIADLLNI